MHREARLKPEFATLYPGLVPDEWEPAGALADKVLASRLRLPAGGFVLNDRALGSGHFEFRGGTPPRDNDRGLLAHDPRAGQGLESVTGGGA